MGTEWVYIGIFILVAFIVPIVAVVLPVFVSPRKPSRRKSEIYECGIETRGSIHVQFKAQYYIYALIFLIFDIETIFLYPWAVALDKLPLFALVEGIIFILILLGGLIYAQRKNVLAWT